MNALLLRGICAFVLLSCIGGCGASASSSSEMPREIVQENKAAAGQKEIYLAGGCFWGTELYLSLVPGVVSAAAAGMRRRFTLSMTRTSFRSISFLPHFTTPSTRQQSIGRATTSGGSIVRAFTM